MPFEKLHDRWEKFAATPRGKRIMRIVRGVFVAAVVGLLVYQVSRIGWGEVLAALPKHPIFYLLVLGMYFLLPVTESLIYGRLWGLAPFACLPIMVRKRVLNVDVVGYSGEVYLFLWARDRVAASGRALMGTIKDNLIVSSAASISAAALLIGGLLAAGFIRVDDFIEQPSPVYVGLGAVVALLIGILVFRFRRAIFSLPRRVLPVLGVAHLSRFFMGYVMQVAAWWVVLPDVPFEAWAILLVTSTLINRIPFLPSSDLVFVSAGAGITPMLGVPVAPVVGMLLVRSAADRILNLILFSTSVWFERRQPSTSSDSASAVDPEGLLEDTPERPAQVNR